MVDMFGPRTKAADDYESARRARRPLKGKAERSIGGGTSGGGGTMKGKAERATAEAVRGRRQGELKEAKMCAGDPYGREAPAC